MPSFPPLELVILFSVTLLNEVMKNSHKGNTTMILNEYFKML